MWNLLIEDLKHQSFGAFKNKIRNDELQIEDITWLCGDKDLSSSVDNISYE